MNPKVTFIMPGTNRWAEKKKKKTQTGKHREGGRKGRKQKKKKQPYQSPVEKLCICNTTATL